MLGKIILLFLIITVSAIYAPEAKSISSSDNATIHGYVSDTITGETLIGATVYLQGTKYGAYTNKSGFYSISNITPGAYTIFISSVGYEKYTEKISFKKGESLRRTFELKPASLTTETISVYADKEVERREITISKIDIPVSQIKNIRIGGESDVFRSLQYLPGILTSSQISSGLYVRGGSPDQNLVLLDGTTVYNPSHLFGFISTFNTDAIKDVELIKGGFPAEYGGRLSAVLNITQKDGNRDKIEGSASAGIISSKASLEGPLGNGSWFVGARRTYLELIKALFPEDKQNPLPDFHFYDVNAKLNQNFGDNDKFTFSCFLSEDKLTYNSYGVDMSLSIANRLAALKWTHIFGDNLFASLNLSGSKYLNDFYGNETGYEFLINNSITDYTLKGSAEWFASEALTAKFGFESTNFTFGYLQNFTGNTDSTQSGSSGGTLNLLVHDWNHSVFGQVNYWLTDLLSLQTGLRYNYWTLSKIGTFDPRLALRYQLQENLALKAAWGIFHQNLRLATQPDFTFFDTWLPTDSTVPASKAIHYILSLESNPYDDLGLNFDFYYKALANINELNMNAIEGSTVADVFYIGSGYSYGGEVFLQKKTGKLTGWIGYAIGWINAKFKEINDGSEFRPKYDRRHDLKIVVQYHLNDDWDFGATFTFQSGQSYTGATSRYQSVLWPEHHGIGQVYNSQRYGLRLPPSHQLNLSVVHSLETFGLPSKLILDIYNVYNRRDIWFRYYNTNKPETIVEDVRLLPILPTLSYEIKF